MIHASELEAEIARNDDVAAYEVYADWLIERGDPRGELILLDLAVERSGFAAGRPPPEAIQAAMLRNDHAPAWLGRFAGESKHYDLSWRRGFIESAALGTRAWDDGVDAEEIDALYAALRALPTASLLRELDFREFNDDDGAPHWDRCVQSLVDHGVPPSLWRLRLGRCEYWDVSWTYLEDLTPVYRHAPQLRALTLELGHMNLGTIVLPELRSFEVRTGGFTKQNLASVIGATWPKLERLALCFGDHGWGGDCTTGDVARLFDRASGALVHLGLANAPFADELVPVLAASPILRGLRTLDLSLGTLSDDGAASIVRHADAFRHLERLDISETSVTCDAVGELRRVVRDVVDIGMKGDGDRYCSIGE